MKPLANKFHARALRAGSLREVHRDVISVTFSFVELGVKTVLNHPRSSLISKLGRHIEG